MIVSNDCAFCNLDRAAGAFNRNRTRTCDVTRLTYRCFDTQLDAVALGQLDLCGRTDRPQNRGALLAALGVDQRHALLGQKLSGLRKRTLGRQLRTLSKQNLKVFARQMNVTRGYLNFNQSGTRDGIQYGLNNLFHTQSPLLSVLIVHTSQMHTHHDVHSARHAVEFLNDVSTRTLLTLPKCLIGGNFGLTHLGAQAV